MNIKERALAVKTHVVEHKTVYIATAGGIVIGVVVTLVIGRKTRITQTPIVDSYKIQYKPSTINNLETIVNIPPRGHRGYAIANNTTGDFYGSISEAAYELGVSRTAVREHLLGLRDSVNDQILTNLGENVKGNVKVVA